MVLGARGWWPFGNDSVREVILEGRTTRGHDMRMVFHDGKLTSFNTHVPVKSPGWERPWSWWWLPNENATGVTFRQSGRRIYAGERAEFPAFEPPWAIHHVLRGVLAEDGRSVRGTIAARAFRGREPDSVLCTGTVTFSARQMRR
jgi:hypothetical protein